MLLTQSPGHYRRRWLAALALLMLASTPLPAAEAHVVVASNFTSCLAELAARFSAVTGDRVVPVTGSTGKLYAQIRHGAPFDALFAADVHRPALLDREGYARPGSRFTYALGRLALWSPDPGLVDEGGRVLGGKGFRHLAIANPKLAPYGAAARQTLQALGLWAALGPRIVRGENIGQAYQFVRSGNAELGFVALAQIRRPGQAVAGSYWLVPAELYDPIEQQAVLLSDNPVAAAFLRFVQGEEGRAIIQGFGYQLP